VAGLGVFHSLTGDRTWDIRTRRLTAGDRDLARTLFSLMAEVFEEPSQPLSDRYLDRLLARDEFWALAAFEGDRGDRIVGGITAHTLPMTRAETSELFIYDVAVHPARQRKGVGRQLVMALRERAAAAGIRDLFVPADNDDIHALDFYRALGGAASAVTFFTFADLDTSAGGHP
jgi:aminoglycoside 3-N-acetyltransferase I